MTASSSARKIARLARRHGAQLIIGRFFHPQRHHADAPDIFVGDVDAVAAQQHGAMVAEGFGHWIAELAGANQGDRIEDLHVVFEHRAGGVQRPNGFAERAEHDAARRMNVANRLHVGARFVNPRVNPKFGIRPAFAGELVAVDVELKRLSLRTSAGLMRGGKINDSVPGMRALTWPNAAAMPC